MHQLKVTFIVKHALLWPIDDEHTDAYRDRTPNIQTSHHVRQQLRIHDSKEVF